MPKAKQTKHDKELTTQEAVEQLFPRKVLKQAKRAANSPNTSLKAKPR
jgi:hypothetical protein